MLTDTTFWIDLQEERRDRRAGPASRFISTHRARELHISIITWGELAEAFADHAELDFFLRGVSILNLPPHVVWTGSRIQRDLAQRGGRLGENDSWIAATALSWGKRLVTRDTAFGRVPRLKLVDY